jgi:hypothetical protein
MDSKLNKYKLTIDPKESEDLFKIDFDKENYKKIHEDILNDISQLKNKKN